MTALLLLAALISAGAPRDASGAAPDPRSASTVDPRAGARAGPPSREDPDAAMLRELELLEKYDLLENPELFGSDGK